jgi:hypothetical protein
MPEKRPGRRGDASESRGGKKTREPFVDGAGAYEGLRVSGKPLSLRILIGKSLSRLNPTADGTAISIIP